MSAPMSGDNLNHGDWASVLTPDVLENPPIVYTLTYTADSTSWSWTEGDSYDVTWTLTLGGGTQTNVYVEMYWQDDSGFNPNPLDDAIELSGSNPGWTVVSITDFGTYFKAILTRASMAVGSYTLTLPFAPLYDGVGDYDAGVHSPISGQAYSDQKPVASIAADMTITVASAGPTITYWNISKTAGANGSYDASAYTNQSWAGDVFVEWCAFTPAAYANIVGLSADNPDANYTGIDRGILCDVGPLYKSENGVLTSLGVSAVAGDRLGVGRVGTAITYYKNGVSIGTGTALAGSVIADTSIRFSADQIWAIYVRNGGTPTAGSPVPTSWSVVNAAVAAATYTVDATSSKACPASLIEAAALDAKGAYMGRPDAIYNFQEASGAIVDVVNARNLTVSGSGTYQQAVSGWSRLALNLTAGSSVGNAATPNANANSITEIFYSLYSGTITASGNIQLYGTSQVWQIRSTAAPVLQYRSGGNVNSGGNDYRNNVRPFVLRIDRPGANGNAYSDRDKISTTYASTPTGASIGIGGAGASQQLHGMIWYAPKTEAQVKAHLQNAGWSIPW